MQSIVKKLADSPIILVSMRPYDDIDAEVAETAAAVDALIDGPGPFFRVNDFSEVEADFCALVVALARETQGQPGTLSDPRVAPVFVGQSDTLTLCVESARQEEYGNLAILQFATLDEALHHIRAGVLAQG